jgi:hypothetical protein
VAVARVFSPLPNRPTRPSVVVLRKLRDAGVKVLLGSEGYEPHVPHQGSKYLAQYPWHVVLAAVEASRA